MKIVQEELEAQGCRKFRDSEYIGMIESFVDGFTFEDWKSTRRVMGVGQYVYDYNSSKKIDDDVVDVYRYMGDHVIMFKEKSGLYVYEANEYLRIMSPNIDDVEYEIWQYEIS